MRFGAEPGDGGTRFRLWAPDSPSLRLVIEPDGDAERSLAMRPLPDGWFELFTELARPGSAYMFELPDGTRVPDPASRRQREDVHGPSVVVDPGAFEWTDGEWRGRPWHETVLYELHTGAFTPQGGFDGVRARLDHLARTGITAIELMPVADFPGRRGWGYDGVLPFAPDASYGTPDDLKRLVQEAHARGLMVFLDVVYNHFGPDGAYLHLYASSFFDERRETPWGAAIDFDGPAGETVREFFVSNALYWLEEFHMDGLRLDAVHAIVDESSPGFLSELADAVKRGPGAARQVHLVLENAANEAHRLGRSSAGEPTGYVAQWNDDLHHALHCLLTGEEDGYYADFCGQPARLLGRALAEGFSYQGEPSAFRGGLPHGEPSAHLPPSAFVNFLQNHDQVGNRAFGDRLAGGVAEPALRAALAVVLLAPSPPMLFMGEEWGCRQPFPYFCDFDGELARAVTDGRRREFARFAAFEDEERRRQIPDPNAESTFSRSVLDWGALDDEDSRRRLEHVSGLLALRRERISPLLDGARGDAGRFELLGEGALRVDWSLGGGVRLTMLANLSAGLASGIIAPAGETLFSTGPAVPDGAAKLDLTPWSVVVVRDAAPEPNERE
jgi:malto-oligosyltrehalose trehalohydrolase